MGSLNKVMLIGNLGRDPEIRALESGRCVCQLRLATSYWHGTSAENGETLTEWHNVVAFGRLAEIGRDHLRKGRRIYVEGRLKTRTYEKENGATHWYTEIVANDIQFLDSATGKPEEAKVGVEPGF